MKNKFILSGTGNDGFWHKYHINKEKGFREVFIKFMNNLGFEQKEVQKKFHEKYEDNSDDFNPVFIEWVIDADEITDEVWYFKNDKYEIDVFFGDKKVFVIVRTKDRKNMVGFLEKEVSWKSEEEFEKIRNENNEKNRQRALKEIEKRSKNKVKPVQLKK